MAQPRTQPTRAAPALNRPPHYREFLSRLLEDMHDQLVRFARRNLRNRAQDEDVFGEVCFRVIREADRNKIDTYELPALKVWIFRVTRNYCMDLNRQSYDKRRLDISDLLACKSDLERDAVLDDSVEAIFDAIADLPDEQRSAVLLCRVERLKAKEAAEVLGISVPALKSRLYRGVHQLRDWLVLENGGVSYFRRRSPAERLGSPASPVLPSAVSPESSDPQAARCRRKATSGPRPSQTATAPKAPGKPGVRQDAPPWFHHPDCPYKSLRGMGLAMAAVESELTSGYLIKMLWFAFNSPKASLLNRHRVIRFVEQDLVQRSLPAEAQQRLLESLEEALSPPP